jgi:ATP-dependent RNA helicase RhlE
MLREPGVARALVFTRTKHGADKVMKRLKFAGVTADAIHGNKAQNARTRALDGFRSGRSRVLVATDVAARGLDVDGITHVFNFDLPDEPEAYVHRIGRTGRAGAAGIAISFCDHEQRVQLRDIERLTGKPIPTVAQLPELKPAAMEDYSRERGPRNFPARPSSRPSNGRTPHAHSNSHGTPHAGGHGGSHGGPRAGAKRSWNQKTTGGRAGRSSFAGR